MQMEIDYPQDAATPPGTASMRASVLLAKGRVETLEVPIPTVGDDQVLVKIEPVGVCGSDVHYFRDGRIGDFVLAKPMILGHEAAGTIVAAGSAVPADRVGQRVAIE